MTKGTPSKGKHNKKTHIACRRCGKRTYHIRHKECSACGFGRAKKIKKLGSSRKLALGKGNRKK
ncbi:MAG: 50S ribosomal protein L37e [Nanoarchaeota archaeon]